MILKHILPVLCACAISFASAQTDAPEKPAPEKKEKAEPEPETPFEKQAFRFLALVESVPQILGKVKDDATLATAEKEIDKMFKKLKTEEAALLKLDIPDNEARKKLSAKMKIKEKAMKERMLIVRIRMQNIPPETAVKLGPMMQKFGAKMNEFEPTMTKYFQPDEEKKKKEEK